MPAKRPGRKPAATKPATKPRTKPAKMPATRPATKRPAAKARAPADSPSPRIAPRADRGEGEAAVQARIAALDEPSRSIMQRLHPLIMKHAKGVEPVVRWGFAMYRRDGKFLLIAAPRKSYVTFGTPNDVASPVEPIKYTKAEDIDEAEVASVVKRALG